MKKHLILLLLALPLTACTDISSRLTPDLLAADIGQEIRLAAHTTQEHALITAKAASPALMPEALQNAAGAEIAAGHITLLAICGNPRGMLKTALENQWLPPSGTVVSLPESACDALRDGNVPAADQLSAAAETGLLPYRPADAVLGDLLSGSGITALYTAENGRLTLSLWDAARRCGTLSGEACRGLALLGNRWRTFSFACGSGVCRVRHTALRISIAEPEGRLRVTVSGSVRAETDDPAAAERILTDMLTAALHETARDAGADLLFLREYAVRGGIRSAAHCKPEEWAELLRRAEYCVSMTVRA